MKYEIYDTDNPKDTLMEIEADNADQAMDEWAKAIESKGGFPHLKRNFNVSVSPLPKPDCDNDGACFYLFIDRGPKFSFHEYAEW